jgi:hypothetical protein
MITHCERCGKFLLTSSDICLECWKKYNDHTKFLAMTAIVDVQLWYLNQRKLEMYENRICGVGQEWQCQPEDLTFDPDVWLLQDEFEWYWRLIGW